jgi:putative methionine-R-sulfoxide reductase with GAF domain
MHGFARPEDQFPLPSVEDKVTGLDGSAAASGSSSRLEETELDSALQLLVERAQYITGATGTALALPEGEEMVCRASAGASAPAVGARLQVRSGLTGESIARRQLLRCDNAETDPRVNLEACRALGIASIVVLPLLRRNGEIRGLFELFSDHPYAFEERDLIALERMADLTLTALDLAERPGSPSSLAPRGEPEKPAASPSAEGPKQAAVISAQPEKMDSAVLPPKPVRMSTPALPAVAAEQPAVVASVPEAMLRVQKCSSCGFPVSEGRTLCLDCEKKEIEQKQHAKEQGVLPGPALDSTADAPEELPPFLANAVPVKESWLANHVNLLAIVVLILAVLVAVVVFR